MKLEWSEKSKYNSFNSWKGLLFAPLYEQIANRHIPVPIEARIDPTLKCPLSCSWCNSAKYRHNLDEMSYEHIVDLLTFLSDWGVKAVCWAGGGEPTYHPRFTDALIRNRLCDMEAGILSNGVYNNPETAEVIGEACRWAGISVDAANTNTYYRAKVGGTSIGTGVTLFDKVLANIRRIVKHSIDCEVSYKFLISPDNQFEIYDACKIAADIGCASFVARPMDIGHQGMAKHGVGLEEFSVKHIHEQFERCHELERYDFRVFTVTHKFEPNFGTSRKFTNCYGAPLKIHCAPDGNCYFCDDQFYNPEYVIGSHNTPTDILKFWGSEEHKQLVYGETPKKCTTRCCVGDYCEQCEQLFINNDDPMFRNFP